jgi:hypothetical protein
MKRKKAPAFGPVAFGEDDHAAARLYPPYSPVNCFNRLSDRAAVNEKAANHVYPNIDKRQKEQFLLGDKSYRAAAIGEKQHNVKIAVMVADKTYAAFAGYVFSAGNGYLATDKAD